MGNCCGSNREDSPSDTNPKDSFKKVVPQTKKGKKKKTKKNKNEDESKGSDEYSALTATAIKPGPPPERLRTDAQTEISSGDDPIKPTDGKTPTPTITPAEDTPESRLLNHNKDD